MILKKNSSPVLRTSYINVFRLKIFSQNQSNIFSGYPNTQFDYSGIGATSTTATANGLKHWSAVDQFATVPLLSSAASVLNSTNNVLAANFSSAINGDSLTNSAGNGETLTSLDHREFLDGRVEQDREKSGG